MTQGGRRIVTFSVAVGLISALVWSWPESTAELSPTSEASETKTLRPPGTVTFSRDIAPILFENCTPCHRPGQSAPFSLLGYADARKRAKQIAIVTSSRFMPPWLPEADHGEFAGERLLSLEEIKLIGQWAVEGAAEGKLADLPPLPQWTEGWQLGEPDLVIELPQSYTLTAEGVDVFRNFVLPIPITGTRYVRAVELQPGNPAVVHHAEMLIDSTRSSRDLDRQEPGLGFEGMAHVRGARRPDGHFLGWTPGKRAYTLEESMVWRLQPGTDLVLQLHMLPSGKPEMIQPSVAFYFAEKAPTRTPAMLRLGSQTIDIPAGEAEYTIEDSYLLPVDVEALGVYPHAHYLGKKMTGIAVLPDGSKKWLISIREWDFNWQDDYRYANPIFLPRGTRLTMQFTYDNTAHNIRNPHNPPRRVVYGDKSSEEMGDLWIQVLPSRPDELAILNRDFARKDMYANIAGLEHALSLDPNDGRAHYDLGLVLLQQGKSAQAATRFQRAIEISPFFIGAHNNLGIALIEQGKLVEAEQGLKRAVLALEEAPAEMLFSSDERAAVHLNLGVALVRQGDKAAAEESFRRALAATPSSNMAARNLALVLAALDRVEEARKVLEAIPESNRSDEIKRLLISLSYRSQ